MCWFKKCICEDIKILTFKKCISHILQDALISFGQLSVKKESSGSKCFDPEPRRAFTCLIFV